MLCCFAELPHRQRVRRCYARVYSLAASDAIAGSHLVLIVLTGGPVGLEEFGLGGDGLGGLLLLFGRAGTCRWPRGAAPPG